MLLAVQHTFQYNVVKMQLIFVRRREKTHFAEKGCPSHPGLLHGQWIVRTDVLEKFCQQGKQNLKREKDHFNRAQASGISIKKKKRVPIKLSYPFISLIS